MHITSVLRSFCIDHSAPAHASASASASVFAGQFCGTSSCISKGRVGVSQIPYTRVTDMEKLTSLGPTISNEQSCVACENTPRLTSLPISPCTGGCGEMFCSVRCHRRSECPHVESTNIPFEVAHAADSDSLFCVFAGYSGCQCSCCSSVPSTAFSLAHSHSNLHLCRGILVFVSFTHANQEKTVHA